MAEDLAGAISQAMQICFDETHGYKMGATMNPDTDCSGLIGYCLANNGFNVNARWDTGGMITALSNYAGFTHYIWSSSFILQHGDIVVYDEGGGEHGHAFIYATGIYGYTATYDDELNPCGSSQGYLRQARIEASSSRGHYYPGTRDPIPGDQANANGCHSEVWVHAYAPPSSGHTWHVFRWYDSPTPPPPVSTEQFLAIVSKQKKRREGTTYENIRYL